MLSFIKKLTFIFSIYILVASNIYAQRFFFESFEKGIPDDWTEEQIGSSDVSWTHNAGGKENNGEKFPSSAKHGLLNAYYEQDASRGDTTRLITVPIDLTGAHKPELSFWHAQFEFGEGDHERLRVLIKTNEEDEWALVQEYVDPTTTWERRAFFIPDSLQDDSTYIAFEGETNWGYGLCLDSIEIIERGIVPFHLKSVEYGQASTKFVTTASMENALLKMEMDVFGNTGALYLNEASFSLDGFDADNIEPGSCKLYLTERDRFNTENQIGTGQSVMNDSVIFESLNQLLNFGKKYLWLSVGIKSDANHGDIIDASFKSDGVKFTLDTTGFGEQNSIFIEENMVYYVVDDDTSHTYIHTSIPDMLESPVGHRLIKNNIYYDDFEGTNNWILNGDFEIDLPQGLGANDAEGSPDPEIALSGIKVLGTDLTGIGPKPGDYENSTPVYFAQLDTINAEYYNNLYLSYFLWINKDGPDAAYIQISVDSNQTWTTVKQYSGYKNTNYWSYDTVDLSNYDFDQSEYLSVRIAMGPTNSVDALSGWNIDNFAISGNFIDKDVGIVGIDAPFDGCGHTDSDTISVWIRNYAGLPVADTMPIPVYYKLNDGSPVYDTVYLNLGLEDSARVTLNTTIDLLDPDIYNIEIATDLPGDEGPGNDDYSKTFYAFPTYTPGYTETFEENEGVFKDYGKNERWQYGDFTGVMDPPLSGVKGWAIGHGTSYANNDSSYLETGCYDFTGGGRHLVEFDYWMSTLPGEDGFNMEFSLDEGETWHVLDSNEFNYDWGWFTDTVTAMNDIGWSGVSDGWKVTRQLLPDSFNTEPKVKFRFRFQSDTADVSNGVGIDNFKVYPAPNDIGVASVDSHVDTCQYANPEHITVTIENYGLNKLQAGDSIVLGFEITGLGGSYTSSDIDTFYLDNELSPAGQVSYQFQKAVDVTEAGNYSVKAYTMYESDPEFYFANNDTSAVSFDVRGNPITMLPDTIQSKEPDTVVIRPHKDPDYTYKWGDGSEADTFNVPQQGVYHVTVTDSGGNGCFTNDSVYVELLFNDAGIDSLIAPVSSCELTDNEFLTVQLRNFGTDSLDAGEEVDIYFEMDDGPRQGQTFNLPDVIHREDAHSFVLSDHALDLSTPGTYKFKMYADIGGDTIPSNDTTVAYVTVYGYPELDIGEDLTLEAYTHTLTAQSGYDQYLWDDGSTADTFHVDTSNWGEHWVTVTDTNNCSSSDTAYIRLIVRDLIPKELTAPVSGCELHGETTISMILENIGNDTLVNGQQVYVSYKINDSPRQIDTITLSESFYPEQQITHDFQTTADFSQPDNYNMSIAATSYNDITTSNDTIDQLIVIDDNPDIDLGNDTTVYAYEYTLEAQSDENWTYVWKNNSGNELQSGSDPDLTVGSTNQYHVIATDNTTGCVGGDTIQVVLRIRDLAIEEHNVPLVLCKDRSIMPELYIRHNGNFPLSSGTLEIEYGIDGLSSFEEEYTFNQSFSSGELDTIVLSNALVFTQSGDQDVFFEIEFEGDMNESNDEFIEEIFINSLPSVELAGGQDTIRQDPPVVLDAGDFPAYTWQDNSTDRTYRATQSGTYSVTVSDINGCLDSDTVYVDLLTSINYYSQDLNEVNVYPVPATHELTVTLSASRPMNTSVEIYDLRGKLILREHLGQGMEVEQILQLDRFTTGVYNLRIVEDKQIMYRANIVISR